MSNIQIRVDRVLDLRGRQCPMTFVYTKVALEEMHTGEILQVILDFVSAFTNVPLSIKKQGLGEILKEAEEIKGIKTLWIKKI
ncbi:MAG: sulfurtransferase TusA family protein [Candidatus Heimdallarchaeota archaeon]|nr:sulfurtransferase TusA family protein [Candidatus Heimdallarchaeota archaeon]